jgi:hypothetical protein
MIAAIQESSEANEVNDYADLFRLHFGASTSAQGKKSQQRMPVRRDRYSVIKRGGIGDLATQFTISAHVCLVATYCFLHFVTFLSFFFLLYFSFFLSFFFFFLFFSFLFFFLFFFILSFFLFFFFFFFIIFIIIIYYYFSFKCFYFLIFLL